MAARQLMCVLFIEVTLHSCWFLRDPYVRQHAVHILLLGQGALWVILSALHSKACCQRIC